MAEGEMAQVRAAVVNAVALAEMGRDLGLGEHLKLGRGEDASGGRDKSSLLADALEAVIGAVYVDRGYEIARKAILDLFAPRIDQVLERGDAGDPKSALQERVARGGASLPVYRVISKGPDHDKRFSAEVFVEGRAVGAGAGRTKKQAEQAAAERAIEVLDLEAERSDDARAS
jgi:ribonuclease III